MLGAFGALARACDVVEALEVVIRQVTPAVHECECDNCHERVGGSMVSLYDLGWRVWTPPHCTFPYEAQHLCERCARAIDDAAAVTASRELKRCSQRMCTQRAAYRYTWPGSIESLVCEEHSGKLRDVAIATGFELELVRV